MAWHGNLSCSQLGGTEETTMTHHQAVHPLAQSMQRQRNKKKTRSSSKKRPPLRYFPSIQTHNSHSHLYTEHIHSPVRVLFQLECKYPVQLFFCLSLTLPAYPPQSACGQEEDHWACTGLYKQLPKVMLQWRGGPANDCYHWAGSGRRNLYVKRDMGTIHSLGIGKDDKKKLCQRGPPVAV